MKKWLAGMLAVVLACSAVAGCGSKEGGDAKETKAAESKAGETKAPASESGDPIVFAYSGPLTGDYAEYGQLFKSAMELAIKQTNESGGVLGRQIELVTFDDKNSSEEAGSIAEKIVDDDRISCVFGHFASGVAMTAAQIYQEEGICLMSASASHLDYSSIGDCIFRNNVTQKVEAKNVLQIAVKNGAKKIGIMKLKTDWGESSEKAFMAGYDEIKDKVDIELAPVEEFVDGTTDYTSNITKLEEAGCDTIVFLGMYGSLGPFLKQFRQVNKDALVISVGSSYTEELIKLAGDATEGLLFPGGLNPNSTDPKIKKFVDDYTALAGKAPENMSAQTYENAMMVIEAIRECGSADRQAIKEQLYKMNFEGITGMISYDEIGDAVKTQILYKVDGGKFVEDDKNKLQTWDEFVGSL